MPAFTFEKISPPPPLGVVPPVEPKQRGVIVQLLDRFAEARVRRRLKQDEDQVVTRNPAAPE
jgi:hypothetical protein